MTASLYRLVMSYFNDIGINSTVERHAWLELRGFNKDMDAMDEKESSKLILALQLRRMELES